MKTLIIIHGADSFLSEETYLTFLIEQYIPRNIESWKENNKTEWKKEIAKEWSQTHGSVYMPTMPNKQSATYRDWKMLFEELIKNIVFGDSVTLIGNSLGGCFLLKYFSEIENFPYQINQIHLIAACISEGDFTPPSNYGYLQELENRVHIWHAQDDIVVPFAVGQELSRVLPRAEIHFFSPEKGYGHFHGLERIPELESVLGLSHHTL